MKILIFIPGLGGSVIADAQDSKCVYFPGTMFEYCLSYNEAKFRQLQESKSLVSPAVLSSYAGFSIYRKFKKALERRHYKVIKTLTKSALLSANGDVAIMMPWVWMYGIHHGVETLYALTEEINQIFTDIYKTSKYELFLDGLILVGHSAGGIVASLYNYRHHNMHVLRVITIGTPFNGVKDAYNLLTLHSRDVGIPWFTTVQALKLANDDKFPILYDLLPRLDSNLSVHLHSLKVDRANALKEEIQLALRYGKNAFRIYIFNVNHSEDYHLIQKANPKTMEQLVDNIYPTLGDGLVESIFINEPHTSTYSIKSRKSHKFILNSNEVLKLLSQIIL